MCVCVKMCLCLQVCHGLYMCVMYTRGQPIYILNKLCIQTVTSLVTGGQKLILIMYIIHNYVMDNLYACMCVCVCVCVCVRVFVCVCVCVCVYVCV